MVAKVFDVAVIGAGPGGYVAAIRAAQLGLKVVCIDRWKGPEGGPRLGGTCLNVGCIPSKALLESSERYHQAQHALKEHGIEAEGLSFNLDTMLARKDRIVSEGTAGIQYLFRKNKIEFLLGEAAFLEKSEAQFVLSVTVSEQEAVLVQATSVIVATGSVPRSLPGIEIDNQYILDNEGALSLQAVPQRLGVIGAGVIGLEMGSVWSRLGSEVVLLEAGEQFLAAADTVISELAWKSFKAQGLKINLGCSVTDVQIKDGVISLSYSDSKAETKQMQFDKLIVAVGRVPCIDGLNLAAAGIELDDRGYIQVDANCQTNVSGVYAIGDVVRGPMLAHKASEEGALVAERIAGQKPFLDLDVVPWVVYTQPEIAWVGKTEQQLKDEDCVYRVGLSTFKSNGRAKSMQATEGLVKILACKKTDRVLGVHIMGPMASELIMQCVVAMSFVAASEDIARIIHAHPSLSEVIREAALDLDARALHA